MHCDASSGQSVQCGSQNFVVQDIYIYIYNCCHSWLGICLTESALSIKVDSPEVDHSRHLPCSFLPSIRKLNAPLTIVLPPYLYDPNLIAVCHERVIVVHCEGLRFGWNEVTLFSPVIFHRLKVSGNQRETDPPNNTPKKQVDMQFAPIML